MSTIFVLLDGISLSDSLYDIEWQEMEAKPQRDLQLILLMAQNVKGFDGIFKTVSLETFQKVWFEVDNFGKTDHE